MMKKNKYSRELFIKYRKYIYTNIIILFIITFWSIIGPIVLRSVLNSSNNAFNTKNIAMYFGIVVLLYVTKYIYNHFKFYFTEKFKNNETVDLYEKVFRMKYSKINELEPTYITERVSLTIETVFSLYVSSLTGILVSCIIMIVTLGMVFYINKLLFILYFVQIPLQYFGFQKLLNGENSKLAHYGTELQKLRATSNKNIKLILSDVNGVKQYGKNSIILDLIRDNLKKANALERTANTYAMSVCTVLEFISICLKNSSYLFIIYMYINGGVSVGDLVYLNLVNDIYYNCIGDVINIQINLRNLKGSLDFVSKEIEDNFEENGDKILSEICTISGSAENIGYGKENVLIKQGEFSFARGDVIGIKGESGCGKTTFVKLLNKFEESNRIYINGSDIMKYDNTSLRGKVIYLPQNTYLLPCSVKDNILMGREVDESRWEKLLKYDFMTNILDKGLDKIVLENASNLSGGDRQKIILARLFMQNPDVVILDESFNAIDEETGESLFEILKAIYTDKIIIIISHSPKYLNHCNKIVEIKDKELIQFR